MRGVRIALVGGLAGVAVVGFATTVAVAWLVLLMLAGAGGSTAMLAGLLGADPAGVVVTAAASTGAPVTWSVPGLGLDGRVWPVSLLFAGSPLALLAVAPAAGATLTGALSARLAARRGHRRAPLVAAGAVGYALVATAAASLAAAGAVARTNTSPGLVLLFSALWAALLGPAGAALWDAARSVSKVRRTAVVAAVALLASMAVATGSTGPGPAPSADPGQGGEPAPVGHMRSGVAGELTQAGYTGGVRYNPGVDPWRGVPSMVSLHSPLNGSVGAWLRRHAKLFAVEDPTGQLKQIRSERDRLGQRHVWYQQVVSGVPVYAARVGVHIDKSNAYVQALSNGMQPNLTPTATKPTVRRGQALAAVARVVPNGRPIGTPALYLLPDQARPGRPTGATLAWRVVWADPTGGEHGVQAYFVAATGTGGIVRTVPVSVPVKFRVMFDYANTKEPKSFRREGDGATGIADLDRAYEYAGAFYDYYRNSFGRDSYNGSGAHLTSWTRWTDVPGQAYANAYWDSQKTVFGDGMVTVDIVGHEWTHAVVERSADLVYADQPGALNESYADIFGEMIQKHHTGSLDWLMGVGSAVGTIRSFANPPDYDQPDHLRDYQNNCFDNGGVHINSGIPNKAFYVLAQRVGTAKAAAVAYRALTTYLHSTSGFTDARNSWIQSAWDLYGKYSQEAKEVWRAWGSVGVDGSAEPNMDTCVCFAEASLHGTGLDLLDPAGMNAGAVASALLRTRDLLAAGASPAPAHYGLVYRRANATALKLMSADPELQRRTAHAMQSLAPLLAGVGTPAGDGVTVSGALVDEVHGLFDAYIAADLAHGDGTLATLLGRERTAVDFTKLVGMTANQAKAYLDQVFAGTAPSGTTRGTGPVVDAAVQHALALGGETSVVVRLRDTARLNGVERVGDRTRRIASVRNQLALTAANSQRGLAELLTARGVRFEQFWIVNEVLVRGADLALVNELAARGEVRRIRLPGTVRLAEPTAETAKALAEAVDGVEWGVDRIRADEVWSKLNVRGNGIVVANIDTGVQYDHPALVNQYRGHRADGTFDHNYNWFDPATVCPDQAPCDGHGHGTHTMGTMVGDDGVNHIGVAPGAKWIAARGCESSSCSEESLLRAGEWILAPTDLNGANPRPDLAPHVVNNSWGGSQGSAFYDDIVNAWVQAGIFPVFANGNDGPGCGTAVSPGDSPGTYAVGAFDEAGAIADFSSRGPSAVAGEGKPNIAAPGAAIRSSVPGDKFETMSGTSMATPHVAGAVALMWSAAPALAGDIAATRQLLDDTAVDTVDLRCGGTADDNNVWGEGRLDAYSAVAFTPRGPVGSIIGAVTDSRGAPIAGARVTATGPEGVQRTVATDPSGAYSVAAPAGTYRVSFRAYGYRDGTGSATVTDGAATRADAQLFRQPRYRVWGELTHAGTPVDGATVELANAGLPATTTAADGVFGFPEVPAGTYAVTTTGTRCAGGGAQSVTVNWDKTLSVTAPDRKAGDSYECAEVAHAFPGTDTVLSLTGDDELAAVNLPFPFPYFGKAYSTVYVSTNGSLTFGRGSATSINTRVPGPGSPDAAIHPFWDDLVVDRDAQVRTGVHGGTVVVEWRNVAFVDDPAQRVTFAVSLAEDGVFRLHYGRLDDGALARGGSATVGVEDGSGTIGLEYCRDRAALAPDTTIEFTAHDGRVRGTVTDRAGPVSGVTVTAENGRTATTDEAGRYLLPLSPGTHTLSFTHPDHASRTAEVIVPAGRKSVTLDVTLDPGPADVSGVVTDEAGAPIAGVSVTLVTDQASPPEATTDEQGRYTLSQVPAGRATIRFTGMCRATDDAVTTVDGDTTLNRTLAPARDEVGYTCRTVPFEAVTADTAVALSGDDVAVSVPIGFPVPFYGASHSTVVVGSNGLLGFNEGVGEYATAWTAPPPPSATTPNNALYAFTDDLEIDSGSRVATLTTGVAPNRRFVVEWRDVVFYGTGNRVTVQAILYEDGRLRVQFVALHDSADGRGAGAGVGIENADGTVGLAAAWHREVLRPGLAIEFTPPSRS